MRRGGWETHNLIGFSGRLIVVGKRDDRGHDPQDERWVDLAVRVRGQEFHGSLRSRDDEEYKHDVLPPPHFELSSIRRLRKTSSVSMAIIRLSSSAVSTYSTRPSPSRWPQPYSPSPRVRRSKCSVVNLI